MRDAAVIRHDAKAVRDVAAIRREAKAMHDAAKAMRARVNGAAVEQMHRPRYEVTAMRAVVLGLEVKAMREAGYRCARPQEARGQALRSIRGRVGGIFSEASAHLRAREAGKLSKSERTHQT